MTSIENYRKVNSQGSGVVTWRNRSMIGPLTDRKEFHESASATSVGGGMNSFLLVRDLFERSQTAGLRSRRSDR